MFYIFNEQMVLLNVLRPPHVRFQKMRTLVICRASSLHCRPSPPVAVISMVPESAAVRTVVPDHQNVTQLSRTSKFVQLSVFNTRHSETEMMRYLYVLERTFTVDVIVLVQW